MSELPERVERAFADHEAFEPAGAGTFEATTTPFEAVVRVRVGARDDADDGGAGDGGAGDDGGERERGGDRAAGVDPEAGVVSAAVTVRAPMLSAAVADGEAVAPVVEEGWFETFERRMAQAHMPMRTDRELDPTVGVDGDRLVAAATVVDADPRRAADDARALVEYVEGTYLEGAIPGYEYDEPVAGLRRQAERAGDAG